MPSSRRLILAAVAALGFSATAGLAVAQAKSPLVSVTSIVEHPALDAVRKGVEEELKAEGFEQGKNLRFQFQSAQGNTATAGQIAKKFVGDGSAVIVAIATPSAQAALAATNTMPVVYTAVTDPVAAKLVKNTSLPSGTNVTGVSDALPLQPQVELMLKVKPDAKRVGMVYSPGEINSVTVAKQLKEELAKRGITLVEASAARSVDVSSAARSLVGKVDLIYTSTDNNVVSTYESLVAVANEAKIPLIAADTDSVKRGATAALGMNYLSMGRQTGKLVVRILKGEKVGDIAPDNGVATSIVLNLGAATKQGATLSEDLRKEAAEIIQ